MTLQVIDHARHARVRRPGHRVFAVATRVEVLVCGSVDRGDDGAGVRAMALLSGGFPEDVAVRFVGQLDIDDLLAVPDGAGIVVVDAALGIDPGRIVDVPLAGMVGRTDGLRPRSSHALSLPEVVGLAGMMRGRPIHGRVVAIGGIAFGFGEDLSWPVLESLPEFRLAIVAAVDRERATNKAA